MKNVIAGLKLVILNFALLVVIVANFIPNMASVACKALADVIDSGIKSAKLDLEG